MDKKEKIKSILVVGGTHGNELTGVEIVKNFEQVSVPSSLQVSTLLANPPAIIADKRYLEKDLNRCFDQATLDSNTAVAEVKIAQKINAKYGPKGPNTQTDFIVDIHNSTANMGLSLIIGKKSDFLLQLCAHLNHIIPNTVNYLMEEDQNTSPYLPTIAKNDLCLEIGPQAHGSILADLLLQGKKCLEAILNFCDQWNQNSAPQYSKITCYEQWKNLDYPRNSDGEVNAYIHPNLQFKDFNKIEKGDPLFIDFSANTIPYQEDEPAWPTFINEHAYYEKGLALSLTRKKEYVLKP